MMSTVRHLSLTTDFMTTLRKMLTIQEKCWCTVSKSVNLSEHLQVKKVTERATKIDEIFTVDLTFTTYYVKSTVKISLIFVAFSKTLNFKACYTLHSAQSAATNAARLRCPRRKGYR